ncbi:MAG: type II toxin-antitoxin system VapC family toxin [Ignavibacteriae bacterium]|nr:type II toxin-antitoxin system VapC family toxin [Ignavibacteriota bacterium]
MRVVDTNVIAYFFIQSSETIHAEALYLKDPVWVAPFFWHSEFLNVLATYMGAHRMTPAEAIALASEAELFMAGRGHSVNTSLVLNLAAESNLSAYDCQFVALARQLGTRLVTADKQLLKAFPADTIPLNSFKH